MASGSSPLLKMFDQHFQQANVLLSSRMESGLFLSCFIRHSEVVLWIELMPMKQANNRMKQNELHAVIRALVFKVQFHPCCNDNNYFFCSKGYVAKESF